MNIENLTQQKTQGRFIALEELQKQLVKNIYPDEPQEFISVLLSNYNDSNFRIVQLSMECIQLLYPQIKSQKGIHQKIFADTIIQFKNIRVQVKEAALQLSIQAASCIDEDTILTYINGNISGKNPGQKVFTLLLIKELCTNSYIQTKQKAIVVANKLLSDASPDVRQEAQSLISQLSGVQESSKQLDQAGQQSNSKKQKIGNKPHVKHNPQNSLFIPPENSDIQAQSQTFSLLPPEPYSYYSYKPLYCYELPSSIKIIIDPIIPFKELSVKKPEQLRPYVEKAFSFISTEKDWIQQMVGIQFIIGLIIYHQSTANIQFQTQLGQLLQEHCLQYLQNVVQCLTSQRSVLQREMAILLEISFQRYGKVLIKLSEALLDACFQLLVKKGVYTENAADSLIKTIIIHSTSKSSLLKMISLIKTTKVTLLKAHILDYLCMFCIISNFDQKIQFWQNYQDLESIIKQTLADANARTRGTAKAFAQFLSRENPQMYKKLLASNQILQKSTNMQAGFLNYDQFVGIEVQDDQFPGYFLQGGACNSEIIPLNFDIQRWRLMLISGEGFQVQYGDLVNNQNLMMIVNQDEIQSILSIQIYDEETEFKPQILVKQQPPPVIKKQIEFQPKQKVQFLDIPDDFENGLEFADPNTYQKPQQQVSQQQQQQIQQISKVQYKDLSDEQDSEEDLDDIEQAVSKVIQTPLYQETVQDFQPIQTAINLKELLLQQQQQQRQKQPNTPDELLQNLVDSLTQDETDVSEVIPQISQYITTNTQVQLIKSLLILLLDFVQAPEIQQQTVNLLITIAQRLPQSFTDLLDFCIPILNSIFRSPNLETRRLVNQLILLLCASQPPSIIFGVFSSILKVESDILANASLRFLAIVARQFKYKKELKQYVDYICPDVIKNFDSEAPEIRKSSTACFIDFYFLLGEDFSKWISSLPADKLKFIVLRMKSIREKGK
ncbi:CLASP domain-containing protein [Spironucleus salmonicida]|uniref:CLASP domain-containing protein n=1 Tax=Spironucleus salmonicida TaxID=348837 RepID=V6LMM6_9EUKA|nr:CLASP domain-containing protein [Spironucleus salmonicida]|eukprot:EST44966.1 CLASP domain-containing protein [Spironucleus salmonicida]